MTKSRIIAAILALLLGGFGAHKFYLGRPVQGVVYFLFCWTFIPAIVALIEAIMYALTPDDRQFTEKYVPAEEVVRMQESYQAKSEPIRTIPGNYTALEQLKDLLDRGAITQEEFDIEKAVILKK